MPFGGATCVADIKRLINQPPANYAKSVTTALHSLERKLVDYCESTREEVINDTTRRQHMLDMMPPEI